MQSSASSRDNASCHEFRSWNSKKRSISAVQMTNQTWNAGESHGGSGNSGGGAIANALRASSASRGTRTRLGLGGGNKSLLRGSGGGGNALAAGVTNALSVPALSAAAKNSLYNRAFGNSNVDAGSMQNASFDLEETVQQAQARRVVFHPTIATSSGGLSSNIFLSPHGGLSLPPLHSIREVSSSFHGDDLGELDLGENFASLFDSSNDLAGVEKEENSNGLSPVLSSKSSSRTLDSGSGVAIKRSGLTLGGLPSIDERLQDNHAHNEEKIRKHKANLLSLTDSLPQNQRNPEQLSNSSISASFTPNYKADVMRVAVMDMSSLLHNSCKLYSDTIEIVESALRMDPDAIRRAIPMVCSSKNAAEDEMKRLSKRRTMERYSYPINIALKYKATFEIIQLLANEGPDVLEERDGPDQTSSLGTALAVEADSDIIFLLLSVNPRSAQIVDRHSNYPLHVAVRRQVNNNTANKNESAQQSLLQIVQKIHLAHPQALRKQNFHNETPLEVAVRSSSCPVEVIDYFQACQYKEMDETHFNDFDIVSN